MNFLALGGLLVVGVSVREYTRTTHENWLASLGKVIEKVWFPNYIWQDLVPRFHFEKPEWKYPYKKPCVPQPVPLLEHDYRVHGSTLDRDAIQRAVWFYTDPKWAKTDPNYHKSNHWDEYNSSTEQFEHIGEIVNYALFNMHYELEDPDQTDFAFGAGPIIYESPTWNYTPPKTMKNCTPVPGVGGVPNGWTGPQGQVPPNPKKYILGRLMGEGTEEDADWILAGHSSYNSALPYNKQFFSSSPFVTNTALEFAVRNDAANKTKYEQDILDSHLALEAGTSYTFPDDGALFQPPAITDNDILPASKGAVSRSGASILAGREDHYSTSTEARPSYMFQNPPANPFNDGIQWQGDGTWDYIDRQSGSKAKLANQSNEQAANYVSRILTRDMENLQAHPSSRR